MSSTRHLWAFGLAATLSACDRPPSDQVPSDQVPATTADRSETVAREVAPFRFTEPRVGQLHLFSSTAVSKQPGATQLELRGQLALLPLQGGGVRAVFRDARVLLNGEDEPSLTTKLAVMAQGSVFHFRNGTLESMGLPEGSSPEASNFWRTFASALQYVSTLKGASTQLEQYDSTGKHTVEYAWAAGVLTRKKLAYKQVLQSGPTTASLQQLEPHIVASKAELVLKEDGLHALVSEERVRTELQQGVTLDITNKLTISELRALSPGDATTSQLKSADFGEGFLPLVADQPIALSQRVDQAQFDEVRIKDWPFDEALEALIRDSSTSRESRAQRSDDEKRRVYSAHAAVTAYLRSVPAQLEVAQKRMWSKPDDAGALLGPLGEAGTGAAQELLLRFAEDEKMPQALRSIAIIEMGQMEAPIPALAPGLIRLVAVDGLAQQALLNLGTLGRKLRALGRTAEFDQVSAAIEGEFAHVGKGRSVGDVLCAISNLGDERLLERVRPFLESQDEKVRGDAVLALRHMKSASVDPLIAAAVSKEHSKLALLTVLAAMNIREPLPMHKTALNNLLARTDLERQVRGRAQQLLDSWQRL